MCEGHSQHTVSIITQNSPFLFFTVNTSIHVFETHFFFFHVAIFKVKAECTTLVDFSHCRNAAVTSLHMQFQVEFQDAHLVKGFPTDVADEGLL